jgi:hypothetical protein
VVATTFMINPWLVPAGSFVIARDLNEMKYCGKMEYQISFLFLFLPGGYFIASQADISFISRSYFIPISFLSRLIFHCLSGPISLLARSDFFPILSLPG